MDGAAARPMECDAGGPSGHPSSHCTDLTGGIWWDAELVLAANFILFCMEFLEFIPPVTRAILRVREFGSKFGDEIRDFRIGRAGLTMGRIRAALPKTRISQIDKIDNTEQGHSPSLPFLVIRMIGFLDRIWS